MVATTLKAAVAARIKNNVVRGLGAACGGRADLLRAIPSEDDHVFSKTPGETTKTPGDTLALPLLCLLVCYRSLAGFTRDYDYGLALRRRGKIERDWSAIRRSTSPRRNENNP